MPPVVEPLYVLEAAQRYNHEAAACPKCSSELIDRGNGGAAALMQWQARPMGLE
jgi:hypothetical protein